MDGVPTGLWKKASEASVSCLPPTCLTRLCSSRLDGQPFVSYPTIRIGPKPAGDLQEILVPVPANTSFVMINGTTGPDRDLLSVAYSVDPPEQASVFYGVNATTKWVTPGILYWAPLDPTVQYNLTLSGNQVTAANISLHSVTFYSGLWCVYLFPRTELD